MKKTLTVADQVKMIACMVVIVTGITTGMYIGLGSLMALLVP